MTPLERVILWCLFATFCINGICLWILIIKDAIK